MVNEEILDQIQILRELKLSAGWELLCNNLKANLQAASDKAFHCALQGKDLAVIARTAQKVDDMQKFLRYPDELIADLTELGKAEEAEIARRESAHEQSAARSL